MTQTLTFFTPGTPRPQGSKRYIGGGRSIESSKHLPAWRKALTQTATLTHNHKPPIQGPITITAIFIFPRPKRLKKKPNHTPKPPTSTNYNAPSATPSPNQEQSTTTAKSQPG
jgi:crossover junction endodeoxyribonuclease RusA